MSKKIILLALAAVSAAILALPAAAMAEGTPLHIVPKPEGTKTIDGEGSAVLSQSSGLKVTCTSNSGTTTFESTTTGKINLKFTGCSDQLGQKCTTTGQTSGNIVSTELQFHLVTVGTSAPGSPGVLITPNGGHFASFTCGFINLKVEGNGIIGTITKPKCGEKSAEATIEFKSSSSGVQADKRVVGTATEYSLTNGGSTAAEDGSGIITLGTAATLECT